MGIIISVANQKGGVGKTTTSSALLAGLKSKGYKTLGIDLDPQGNLSQSLGAENDKSATITDVLTGESTAWDAIQALPFSDMIPANVYLSIAEKNAREVAKEFLLKEAIESLKDKYDFIVIDTPPALGFLTVNAFTASDVLIIPSTPSTFSINGVLELHRTIEQARKYCNPSLKIAGVLVTRLRKNTNVGKDLLELTTQIGERLNAEVFSTTIRDSIAIEDALTAGRNITEYDKLPVAQDYDEFVTEFLRKEGYTNEQ